MIREKGAPDAVIAHRHDGAFDVDELVQLARDFGGLEGMDLARGVSTLQTYKWDEGLWKLGSGYAPADGQGGKPKVIAVDYGLKRNILRSLIDAGADVTVVPATASFDDIMAHDPAGLFLSNGPGDPAATGEYAVPVIRQWLDTGKPLFGICLGHQLLGLAVGAKTAKMHQGHRGAKPPGQADRGWPRRNHQHESRFRGRA